MKKLRVFSLAVCVFALVAGIAWAFDTITITGTRTDDLEAAAEEENIITGNGKFTGSLTGEGVAVRIRAVAGNTVEIAPARAKTINGEGMQLVVNDNANSFKGTVIVRASNADNPEDAETATVYNGGTIQGGGTLGVTNSNSLGQGWIGVRGNVTAHMPIFKTHNTDAVFVGGTDPAVGNKVQPFYLVWSALSGVRETALRYVNVEVNPVSSASEGLRFNNGLAQLDIASPSSDSASDLFETLEGFAAPAVETPTHYLRLVKTGKGVLYISGATKGGDLTNSANHTSNLLNEDTGEHKGLDGAFHRGGTTVEGGILRVKAGAGTTNRDRLRASLGRTWNFSDYQGTKVTGYEGVWSYLDLAEQNGMLYNPLLLKNGGTVELDRSQFFGSFNINEGGTFEADDYQIAADSGVSYPQITVGLQDQDSFADGLMKGNFDFVLNAKSVANGWRPADDPADSAIVDPNQAVLFINNAENQIGTQNTTLVANGVLEVAGAKSIGGGRVTMGANGGANAIDRHFVTDYFGDDGIVPIYSYDSEGNLVRDGYGNPVVRASYRLGRKVGVFAASKTFELPNVARGQSGGAAAAENGTTLSFKDFSLVNLGRTPEDSFRINPKAVPHIAYQNTWASAYPNTPLPTFHGAWTGTGTVTFGGTDAKWNAAGTIRNPSRVDIERGVWHLASYPAAATDSQNSTPFLHTYVWPEATLSLEDGVRDFNTTEAQRMNLWVHDDSRIRVVLNDDDIASSRAEAMSKKPVFEAFTIDYSALGMGEQNRDRRLVIQLDASKLSNPKSIPSGWVKAVYSETAPSWNNLHFLRESSNVNYEDYVKVRVTWLNTSDLPEGTKAVAHADENSNTILIEFGADVDDPVNPSPDPIVPPQPAQPETLPNRVSTPTTEIANTDDLVITVDGLIQENGVWKMRNTAGESVELKALPTVRVNGSPVTVPAGNFVSSTTSTQVTIPANQLPNDTANVAITVVAEPANDDFGTMTATSNATIKVGNPSNQGDNQQEQNQGDNQNQGNNNQQQGDGDDGGSSGGCDAGFGALSMAIAAAFLLCKKD